MTDDPESEAPETVAWQLAQLQCELSRLRERMCCSYTGEVFRDEYSEDTTFIQTPDPDELYAINKLKVGERKLVVKLLRSDRKLDRSTLDALADYIELLPQPKKRKPRTRPVSAEQYRALFIEAIINDTPDLIGAVCDKSGMERTVVYQEYRRFNDWFISTDLAREYQDMAGTLKYMARPLE